ncbi:hypothetical protein ACJX0J_010049, partial [Zea mays]
CVISIVEGIMLILLLLAYFYVTQNMHFFFCEAFAYVILDNVSWFSLLSNTHKCWTLDRNKLYWIQFLMGIYRDLHLQNLSRTQYVRKSVCVWGGGGGGGYAGKTHNDLLYLTPLELKYLKI